MRNEQELLDVMSFDSFTIFCSALCTGVSLDADLGPNSVFHPPSKETVLTSTTTFGPKPFVFIPQQVRMLISNIYLFHSTVCMCGCVCSACPRNHLWRSQQRPWLPLKLHLPLSWQASGTTSVPSPGGGVGTARSLFLLNNQGEGN